MRPRGTRASPRPPARRIPATPRCYARSGDRGTSRRSRLEGIASASRSRAPASQLLWRRRNSSVARGAAGAGVDFVALRERTAGLHRITFRLPGHVGDLLDGPQVLLRMAMAIQTPAHRKRRCLLDGRHLIDAAVATHAPDAFVNVGCVIEIDEIRHAKNAAPLHRPVFEETSSHRLEKRTLVPHLRVAVQTERR